MPPQKKTASLAGNISAGQVPVGLGAKKNRKRKIKYIKVESSDSDGDYGDEEFKAQESKTKMARVTLPLSLEQKDVVDAALARKNSLVIAKAGSGKSTTALSAAKQFYEKYKKRTLLITYNTRLKNETREKIIKLHLENAIEAHSYHAVAGKYFVSTSGTADNTLIHRALRGPPKTEMDFGLVVIDEAQDMNNLYCRFVQHMLKNLREKPTMLLIGDPFQRIFGFNGASCDFLTQPQKYFGELCHVPDFCTRHLSICWRITHEMAGFINSNLNPCNLKYSVSPSWWSANGDRIEAWWGKGIRANPKRKPAPNSVAMVRGWGSQDVIRRTKKMFRKFGNDEVALLAFSLKGVKTPIRAIVDKLGHGEEENWAVLSGSSLSTEEVLKGKRLASTVHRMKGLERRGIVVCGFDAFIERLYPNDPLEHFNLWYVACTRAKDQLLVNVTGTDYATVRCCRMQDLQSTRQQCEVLQLVEYVPFDDVLSVPENLFDAKIEDSLDDRKAVALDKDVTLVEGRAEGTVEDISPFLSRAISFRLMLRIHKQLFEIPVSSYATNGNFDDDMVDFVQNFYSTPADKVTWPNLVKYSVAYETFKSRYKHIWRQLHDFEAITPVRLLEQCTNNAFDLLWKYGLKTGVLPSSAKNVSVLEKEKMLAPLVKFEVATSIPFFPPWFTEVYIGQVYGLMDVLFNGNTILGIECSPSIPGERGLELSLYAAMERLTRMTPQDKSKVQAKMILTNSGKLVNINLKLQPVDLRVPMDYELLYRAARRKLQVGETTAEDMYRDYSGTNGFDAFSLLK